MRFCVPIEFKPHGGGFYFLDSFERYLRQQGHEVHRELGAPSDILFTNHWMVSRRDVLRALKANPQLRVVQRIDGAAQDYGRDPEADRRQRAVNALADLTIFQSEYCRYSTREKYPVIGQDGPVIHNPVDIQLFRPDGPKKKLAMGPRLVSVSWSTNPMKGAASIYALAEANPQLRFILVGNYPDAPDLPNLSNLGVLPREELAAVLRSAEALLTFSRNEACPNHVLEAMASGLPVLYYDSGAMAEVVGDAGLPVSEGSFPAQFEKLMEKRTALSQSARRRAEERFNPDIIFAQYMQNIQAALARPSRVAPWQRQAHVVLDGIAAFFAAVGSKARGGL